MDDYTNEDTLVDRAMAMAQLAATADSIPDGEIRELLIDGMKELLRSIKPNPLSGQVVRIK